MYATSFERSFNIFVVWLCEGSAIALSAATYALFKQCNIYDEFVSLGKKTLALQVIANEQRRVDYIMDFSAQQEV